MTDKAAAAPVAEKKGARSNPLRQPGAQAAGPQASPAGGLSAAGNLAVQHLLRTGAIQAKFSVSQPGDKYEQEADRTADAVLRIPEPAMPAEETTPVVATDIDSSTSGEKPHRKNEKSIQSDANTHPIESSIQNEELDVEERESFTDIGPQRKPVFESTEDTADEATVMAKSESGQPQGRSDLQQRLDNSKGSGRTLPENTRASLESAFGADFSNVKIHTGADAVEMNKGLGAQAFTHGSDIYFNEGQYDPGSSSGRHLLAHELTHTVQQGGSALRAKRQTGEIESRHLKTDVPNIQAAWYNVHIPFTDYEFDPSIEGVKNAANIAKDVVVEGAAWVKDKAVAAFEWIVDEIKRLISSGKDWLSEQWSSIQEFASSGFDFVKDTFVDIIGFIQSPLTFIANAIMSFDAESVTRAWGTFVGIVSRVWEGFRAVTGNLLEKVNSKWSRISGYASSLFNRVAGLTENSLFKRLPNALQQIAYTVIDGARSLWKGIDEGWKKIFNKIKTWIDKALDTVFKFVLRVTSFAINVIIEGIIQFGELVLFLKDLFTNPQKYIDILASKSVEAFEGVESRFSEIISQYFGEDKKVEPDTAMIGTIQRQPDTGTVAEAKGSASWGEIGSGIWEMMGKKWKEFKANPWSIVIGLLMDMIFPMVGNIKDIVQLFKDIWKIVTGPLSAGSLEELWTSFLQILDIPILIYHTIVSILMRSLMVPLIVASFIPHPLVKAIAAAVGYSLLGAFVEAELLSVGQKLLLLKTGATTKAQKEEAYNRLADSFIAMAMTAVIILIMLILHFIANIMKGIYNFVKGKVFAVETAPVEGKGGLPGEGKEPAKVKASKTVDVDEASAKRMETSAKTGLDPTPDTIREGSVRMEAHPNYDATIAEIKRLGFDIKNTSGDPHVTVREIVSPDGDVIRLEKELYVRDGMRFLDLEHELGHIKQLTERFGSQTHPTERWIEYPDGTLKETANPPGSEVLTKWQDTITEYHNRLEEYLRLHERNASPELLREHAGGIKTARAEYNDVGLKGGRSPSRLQWAQEHFPDISKLQKRYIEAGGPGME